MKNHQRYTKKATGAVEYALTSLVWRIPSDRIILPIIKDVKNKDVCDVGCGNGRYSGIFLNNGNRVTGVDINDVSPQTGVKTLKGDAARLTAAVSGSRFDIVFSAWLTEYLDKSELADYFRETRRVLKDNGTFMTTVIDDRGWGKIYTAAAFRARGILKYAYSQKYSSDLLKEAGFSRVSALPLRSWFGVPWATFFICAK